MKIIKQLFWIFLFSLLGEGVSLLLAYWIAIPGSVIGMLLLFSVLHFGILSLEKVEEVGNWLTDNMAIFFVPAGVGLMTNFELLADIWFELLVIVLVTVSIMIAFMGKLVEDRIVKAKIKNDFAEGVDLDD